MLFGLINSSNRVRIYDKLHRVSATVLISITGLAFVGCLYQFYLAKTQYLPEIRSRGKDRLQTTLATRQQEAELLEQQRLIEKELELASSSSSSSTASLKQ